MPAQAPNLPPAQAQVIKRGGLVRAYVLDLISAFRKQSTGLDRMFMLIPMFLIHWVCNNTDWPAADCDLYGDRAWQLLNEKALAMTPSRQRWMDSNTHETSQLWGGYLRFLDPGHFLRVVIVNKKRTYPSIGPPWLMFYTADILDAIQVKLDTKLNRPAAMANAAKETLNKVNIQDYLSLTRSEV